MLFTDGNIFFVILSLKALSIRQSLVKTLLFFLLVELHSSSPCSTLKLATPDFLLELEHTKIEQLPPTTAI